LRRSRDAIAYLSVFIVAVKRSFTKAATRLGMAQSAMSQTVRRTDERLGLRLRLLSRTTRTVAPTEAGERLLSTLGLMLHALDAAVAALGDLRDRPSGTIRITTVEHAAKTIVMPAVKRPLPDNPDINVEIHIDYGFADVVADGFHAGVCLGGEIAKDMIAAHIGPDIPIAIVDSSE
jgi:DNA-binding transcriptional LysR family regulator